MAGDMKGNEPDWNKCLCHMQETPEPLTSFSLKSWRTFENAANARNDNITKIMTHNWENGPKGNYHRTCYQVYTSKSHINRLGNTQNFENPPNKKQCLDMSGIDKRKCVICQRNLFLPSKNGSRKLAELSAFCMPSVCDSFEEIAKHNNDDTILKCIAMNGMTAKGLLYHNNCYRKYSKTYENYNDSHTQSKFSEAFAALSKELNKVLLEEEEIISLNTINERFKCILEEQGIDSCNYQTQKLKIRMQKHFGNQIEFCQPSNKTQSLMVVSSGMSKGKLIEQVTNEHDIVTKFEEQMPSSLNMNTPKMSKHPAHCHPRNCDCNNLLQGDGNKHLKPDNETYLNLYHSAKIIRHMLQQTKNTIEWTPMPEDLQEKNSNVPDMVYNFIAWIVHDDSREVTPISEERVMLPSSCHMKVLSMAQDLVYNTTHGRVRTAKHIALPMALHSLTGSAELVTILNRYGHGISYTQVEEIQTALAEKQLENQKINNFLPGNIQGNIFPIFCWDNNDFSEETQSGKGTTHCTMGIVIQRSSDAGSNQPGKNIQSSSWKHARRRTIQDNSIGHTLPYNAVPRTVPLLDVTGQAPTNGKLIHQRYITVRCSYVYKITQENKKADSILDIKEYQSRCNENILLFPF